MDPKRGKSPTHSQSGFFRGIFLLEAQLLSEADQAGAGGSRGGTSLLGRGFDPSPIHDSSLSMGWLTFRQSALHLWPEGCNVVFPRRGITALAFIHSNPKSSQLEIIFMRDSWTSFPGCFCFLH